MSTDRRDNTLSGRTTPNVITYNIEIGGINPYLNGYSSSDSTCPNRNVKSEFKYPSLKGDNITILERNIIALNIKGCSNKECKDTKAKMNRVAPSCKSEYSKRSEYFRDWVLVVMSCLHCQGPDSSGTLYAAVEFCVTILMRLGNSGNAKWSEHDGIDLFGWCELLYWMAPLSPYIPHSHLIQDFSKEDELSLPKIREAVRSIPGQLVCQHQLWNLVMATDRGLANFHSIVSAVKSFKLFSDIRKEFKHSGCIAQTCLLADHNTTDVEQLHICGSQDCEKITFPVSKLNSGSATAWSILEPYELKCTKYVAISHVWSDGTGMGSNDPGTVNECLFNFFKGFSNYKDCEFDEIWWDTISIPTDRKKKKEALSKMHENFKNATYTLVHDRELVSFDWKEDGSPCLALALSTWFTRGWTALELWASQSVKVIFRDPDSKKPLIKDLETHILAKEKSPFVHPAHIAVSAVINRIRGNIGNLDEDPISQILAILRPRYTCWASDRILIAGLMADIGEFKPSWNQVLITQSILKKLGSISCLALLHGNGTIQDSGPWSWCPPSLFDLKESTQRVMVVQIQKDGVDEGTVIGYWKYRRLLQGDAKKLNPVYSHPSVLSRITAALQNLEGHLLLAVIGPGTIRSEVVRYLLVKDLGRHRRVNDSKLKENFNGEFLECRYVGTVTTTTPAFTGRQDIMFV